jgi:predicted metalloprotease
MSEESSDNPVDGMKQDEVQSNPVDDVKQDEVQSNPVEHEENDDAQSEKSEKVSEEVVQKQESVWESMFDRSSRDYWMGVAVGSAAVMIGLTVSSFIRNRY